MSGEALQIAERRRKARGQGEKERYTPLKAEFQRITRRDKKAFIREQYKEIKENNRMGKTRDLLKKVRNIHQPIQYCKAKKKKIIIIINDRWLNK